MTSRRLLVIGLDGFDLPLAEKFQAEGLLPNFTRFQKQAASFRLDHGRDKYSGLSWEHLSSGVAPSDGGRWSAVDFHKDTYAVRQEFTTARPFVSEFAARTVVFDFPYFDLDRAPNVRGISTWGAHDPGVASGSRPDGLHEELRARFGPYPASEFIYGFSWPSPSQTRVSGESLVRATNLRSQVTQWLFAERLRDWDLGIVVISEGHSAIEPLWHGVDETHPLHHIESAPIAAAALREVYQAIDRMIGELCEKFPDATVALVAMHGMGSNDSDVAAMALLPELLYRNEFGRSHMRPIPFSGFLPDGTPLLADGASWHEVLLEAVPEHGPWTKMLPGRVTRLLERAGLHIHHPDVTTEITWMPTTRYSHFWSRMKAFALPSFYDGRIRLNVRGREAKGLVPPEKYEEVCRQITELVTACRNLQTGEEVVDEIYSPKKNPMDVGPTESDIYVIWKGAPLGLIHPRLGCIGPVPHRRTGGHTGQYGFLSIVGEGMQPGNYGVASSFDVVPTIVDLLGETKKPGTSGKSLMPALASYAK